MSEIALDLEQELRHLRTEIIQLENQLALLNKKRGLTQKELSVLRREFRSRSESGEVNSLVCQRVRARAKGQGRLVPGRGWSDVYTIEPGGILIAAHYSPDTSTGNERFSSLGLVFKFLTTLRSEQPAFELIALGSSEVVLVVPGADLWGWLNGNCKQWDRSRVDFSFTRRLSTGKVWLTHVEQARRWGRGWQTHTCWQGRLEVTHCLNRYDLLTAKED